MIGRGAHLAAIKAKGIELHWQDGRVETARVKAVETAAEASEQDLVVLAVKAHSLEQAAADVRSAARARDHGDDDSERHAVVVFPEPWRRLSTARDSKASIPSGVLSKTFHPDRIIGCAVFVAAEVPKPGVVRHIGGNRFPMGEIDGTLSERMRAVEAAFVKAELAGERAQQHSRRDLVEGFGQSRGQSDQRADQRDDDRDPALPRNPRARARDDAGGARDRRQARHRLHIRRSSSGWKAPSSSARIRPRCCRTWRAGGPWRSRR